jgi:hypothetical protein
MSTVSIQQTDRSFAHIHRFVVMIPVPVLTFLLPSLTHCLHEWDTGTIWIPPDDRIWPIPNLQPQIGSLKARTGIRLYLHWPQLFVIIAQYHVIDHLILLLIGTRISYPRSKGTPRCRDRVGHKPVLHQVVCSKHSHQDAALSALRPIKHILNLAA